MADKLVTVKRFANYIEAEMASQLLDDNGIKSVVLGENASTMYIGLTSIIPVELQTFEAQAQQALEILNAPVESVPEEGEE